MNTDTNTNPLTDLIADMIAARRDYATANGITVTDNDIGDMIRNAVMRFGIGTMHTTCPECERTFDLTNPDHANEWHHGHDCEPE